ncbi:MAG: hypothetical protein JSS07_03920 [Proteobacteria bacterium]|nr:hypothetical protein [Pseudomonadota bacterium]
MHILTEYESYQIYGGIEQNFKDGLLTSVGFSWLFGLAGAGAFVSWLLSYPRHPSIIAVTAVTDGYPLITIPIAIVAGLGLGNCIGTIVGLGFYYSGLVTMPE